MQCVVCQQEVKDETQLNGLDADTNVIVKITIILHCGKQQALWVQEANGG